MSLPVLPRPWAVKVSGPKSNRLLIVDANGDEVCEVNMAAEAAIEGPGNAEMIVAAVNAFPESP